MSQTELKDSELVLNQDGSVYHLDAFPDDIADIVITVGDPDRVASVSQYFDKVEVKRQKREFVTHTGWLGDKRMTVVSTGIGVDNVDIVLTELDALVNVDFATRQPKAELKQLDIVRLGTCGGLQPELSVNDLVVSSATFGFDNLMHYYQYEHSIAEQALQTATDAHFVVPDCRPYAFIANDDLVQQLSQGDAATGITATCPGFYGPQGRRIRAVPRDTSFLNELQTFEHDGMRVLNFEMETSGLIGLGQLLGHRVCSVSAVMANRVTGEFSKTPGEAVDHMIQTMLNRLNG